MHRLSPYQQELVAEALDRVVLTAEENAHLAAPAMAGGLSVNFNQEANLRLIRDASALRDLFEGADAVVIESSKP